MRNCVCEYDGYKLPNQLDRETPESKKKLQELYEETKLKFERYRSKNTEKKKDG